MKIKWLLFFLAFNVFGETNDVVETSILNSAQRYDNYIGYNFGITAGPGLSYRRIFKDFDLQISFSPDHALHTYPTLTVDTISSSVYDSGHVWQMSYIPGEINGSAEVNSALIGVEFIKSLHEMQYGRSLCYLGITYDFSFEKYDYEKLSKIYQTTIAYQSVKGEKYYSTIRIGGGIGVDILLWRFAINIMGGFCGSIDLNNYLAKIDPSTELGVFYRF